MMDLFNLADKVAIVTGGYGHLGSGMARALLACDAEVIIAGKSIEKYDKAFNDTEKAKMSFMPIDITKTSAIERFLDSATRKYGNIDVLINNAYTVKGNKPEYIDDEDWIYTMEGVVGSVYKMIRSIAPIMKAQGSGKIINISSMYGLVSPDFGTLYKGEGCEIYTNPPHYGAAKSAVLQLTRYFAALLGENNIQVNAIVPGPFPNVAIQNANQAFIERLKSKNPLHKIGKPEDLYGVVALLSSSASDFITGQAIQVDGGWTIW